MWAPAVSRTGRALARCLVLSLIAGTALTEYRISEVGRSDLMVSASASTVPFLAAVLACWAVGLVLSLRVPGNTVGWLFLGLGTSIAAGAFFGSFANEALRAEPNRWPLGGVCAVLADSIFAWWFLFVGLILQYTPTGRPLVARASWLARTTTASAGGFVVATLLRSTPLQGENAGLVSPLAVRSLSTPIAVAGGVALLILALCLLASIAILVARFRTARDAERRQMLWLLVGAAPLPVCLVASFGAAYARQDLWAGVSMSLGIVALALGAGFSVAKYRLYDVERIASDAAAYAIAASSVVAAYGLVAFVLAMNIPIRTGSVPATIASTLAAAGIALPAYRWARTAIDRRFHRRRFEALRILRAGLAQGAPDLEQLMSTALGDPNIRVFFRLTDKGWVSADGRHGRPGHSVVDVIRNGKVAATIEFDPHRTDQDLVEAVALEAAAEIDNLGLRADLGRQLQEVSNSRARLANAHLEERRRMERDLHDGAQQRLLAIALQIQSARVNGSDKLLRDEADRAVTDLGLAVQELRDLAHGLLPASLAGGGLRAATEELADRIPLGITVDVADARFDPAVENAAWFVVAEAVSNAVKHAGVSAIHVAITAQREHVRVSVSDHGPGGADCTGHGLQGLADRVAALGGTLTVRDIDPHGTWIEATLPCAS